MALVAAFVVLYFQAAAPGHSADTGLVAAYSFDEGTGPTIGDSSGNGLTGTITGATWTTTGKYGKALSFNGSTDFVDLGNPVPLQITGSMTWSAWVYPTGTPADDGQIIAKSSGQGGGWQFKTSPDTGPHTFGVGISSSATANVQRYSNTVRALDTWYYVTGVYNAGAQTLDIYVNGVLDNGVLRGGPIPSSQVDSTQGVTIGRRSGGFYFQGTIDELRIYNRALSAAEVQTAMTTPVGPQDADSEPPGTANDLAAAPMSNNRIDLSWDPATDNRRVTTYGVERCGGAGCTNFTQIASAPSTSWSDNGLSPSTTYRYRVRAADAAGNVGPYSAPATATTVAVASAFSNDVVVQNLNFVPGTLRVVQPGATQPDSTPFLVIPSAVATADAGLHDLVLDPSFATNRYLYVFYEHAIGSSFRDTVSRFTAAPDLNSASAASEFVLWQDDAATTTGSHHGASLAFGPDGKLYISTGDNGQPPDSQSLTSYHGKILRINPDGSIPTDNPFVDGQGGNKDEIWAYGLRNPYRMTFEPSSGRLYVADVGGNVATSIEELDLISRGANYGWPLCDGGPCASQGVSGPVFWYPHEGRDAAIMGGFFYTGNQFPAAFKGSYFFADYAQNWLKRLTFDPTGTVVTGVFNLQPLDGSPDSTTIGDPVQLHQGPDGALYYLDLSFDEHASTFNDGTLHRIRFVGTTNQPPDVVASATPLQGQPPLNVDFSSAGTQDPDGDQMTFAWSFGDGSSSTAPNPSHTYASPGQYTATLTVSDGTQTSFKSLTIRVGTAPVGRILTPSSGTLFQAGDHILISGDGTDAEDGSLPDSAFSWTVIFHHETHVHPGVGPVTGVRNLAFDIPTTGHDFSGNTSYEIVLKVTDSSGLSHTSSVSVIPDKVNVSVDTVPSGLNVEMDGITRQTPFVYDGLKGFHDSFNAPSQTYQGTPYQFASWSDGGAQSHEITVPQTNTSLVATFQADTSGPAPVAAYGFEEGSGTTARDSSGNGLTGTIVGAAWTSAGKYGNALSFNGTSNYVDLGNPTKLRLTGSMTWSAWIYATGNPPDDGQIVAKSNNGGGAGGGWQFKTSPDTGPHTFGVGVSADGAANAQRYSRTVRALNTWYYVAGVYDAPAKKLDIYVNGVLDDGVLRGTIPAGQFDSNQNVNIGRRTGGFYFKGTIDEVRVYDAALSAAQVQADMAKAVAPQAPDTQAPTVPAGLATIAVGTTSVAVSWTASTDNVGVARYQVERCSGPSCSTFAQVATPTGTTYNDSGLIAGTSYSYRVRAVDAAGNLSAYSSTASATTTAPDTTPPTPPSNLAGTPGPGQVALSWSASTDSVGVTGYQLERCSGSLCSNFAQIAAPTGTTFTDTGLAPSTSYSYRVRAVDAAANNSGYSNVAVVATPAGPSGLVAGFGFSEGTGTTVADSSGSGTTGTIRGATWTPSGKYGNALLFNGTTGYVDLGNPTQLRITGSMTWEAWVYATGTPFDDGQIIAKSSDGGGTGGWQFKTSPDTGPHTFGVGVSTNGSSNVQRYSRTVRSLNTWYHVAGVYNAQARTLDIYVNGVIDNGTLRGTVPAAQFDPAQSVTIGRRTGGYYFQGRIDEVRVYNRALSAAEVQADMNTPIGP
jgi:glucose/arabinose dehydrogenase